MSRDNDVVLVICFLIPTRMTIKLVMNFTYMSLYYLCDEVVSFGFMFIIEARVIGFQEWESSSLLAMRKRLFWSFMDGKKACMRWPPDMVGKNFFMYSCVISDLGLIFPLSLSNHKFWGHSTSHFPYFTWTIRLLWKDLKSCVRVWI